MKLVGLDDFDDVLTDLSGQEVVYCDTESTGLRPYHGDRLFSLVLGTEREVYYFNFISYEDLDEQYVLDMDHHLELIARRLCEASPKRLWVLHNAKFDMHMLRASGVELMGDIYCTMTMARVLDSSLSPQSFSLDELGTRIGYPKDLSVKEYIGKKKLWTERLQEGTGKKIKDLHYDQVPFDLISRYAARDVEVTRALYHYQKREFDKLSTFSPGNLPKVTEVLENEQRLLRTVFEMESQGVCVDTEFCKRAIEETKARAAKAAEAFEKLTGERYKDSSVLYQKIFADEKERWVFGPITPKTGKSNPIFDYAVLETFKSPAAKLILSIRDAEKEGNYYAGFLAAVDPEGRIHCNLNQHGTTTGRFSSSNPNLQNLTSDEGEDLKKEFIVRRAIVPSPGNVFHMIDFKSMEYRLMCDYAAKFATNDAGIMQLVKAINRGEDVHQATADRVGIERKPAKAANFAILYGAGNPKLAESIKSTVERAAELRAAIFTASPEMEVFIESAKSTAAARGYVVNWFGRRLVIGEARFAYRAPNYLIQGGTADVVKIAMNRVRDYLLPYKTRLVLCVHDEFVLDGPASEAAKVVPAVAKIMENIYPRKLLTLEVDIEHSALSLADKEKGVAIGR